MTVCSVPFHLPTHNGLRPPGHRLVHQGCMVSSIPIATVTLDLDELLFSLL